MSRRAKKWTERGKESSSKAFVGRPGSLLPGQIIRFAAHPPTGAFWDTRWHLPFSFAVSPFSPLPIERNEKKLFPHRKRYRLGPLSGICRFIRSHFAREALKIRPEILPINPNHPVGEQCSCLSNHNSTLSSFSYPQIDRNAPSRAVRRGLRGLFRDPLYPREQDSDGRPILLCFVY